MDYCINTYASYQATFSIKDFTRLPLTIAPSNSSYFHHIQHAIELKTSFIPETTTSHFHRAPLERIKLKAHHHLFHR